MAPFKSDKQRKFLHSQKPEVARKFEQHSQKQQPQRKSGRKMR